MTDREAMQMALDALNLPSMKTQQMLLQRDEAITALRAKLEQPEQNPVALIRDGVLRWHIPHEYYSRPAWTAHGTHMLYASPPQRKPLTDEQRIEVLRTTKFRDWFIAGSRGAASRAAEVAQGIGEKP